MHLQIPPPTIPALVPASSHQSPSILTQVDHHASTQLGHERGMKVHMLLQHAPAFHFQSHKKQPLIYRSRLQELPLLWKGARKPISVLLSRDWV